VGFALPVPARPVVRTARPAALDRITPEPVSQGGWSRTVADNLLGAQLAFARSAPANHLTLASFAPGMGLSPAESGLPQAAGTSRWSGAAWMLWRGDETNSGYARGPRLGGSQMGARVDYAVAPGSTLRPALYGRVSSALRGPAAAEVAAGIAIRPRLPLPTTIGIERREGVSDGGRSAFAVIAASGIGPVDIGHGFRLDGYAQAGLVGFRRGDGFVDGRVTMERAVAIVPDVAVGASIWGGTQPGTSRLDIGPHASLRLTIGSSNIRLGAEWREQVAGDAAPSSGPAITLGTDF
jgi:hypothetical protein